MGLCMSMSETAIPAGWTVWRDAEGVVIRCRWSQPVFSVHRVALIQVATFVGILVGGGLAIAAIQYPQIRTISMIVFSASKIYVAYALVALCFSRCCLSMTADGVRGMMRPLPMGLDWVLTRDEARGAVVEKFAALGVRKMHRLVVVDSTGRKREIYRGKREGVEFLHEMMRGYFGVAGQVA